MCPLPLLVVVAVKILGVVTSRAETKSVCNDSNFTILSVSMDICVRIKIILQPCWSFITIQISKNGTLYARKCRNQALPPL